MNIETTYDVVVLAEASLYAALVLLVLMLCMYFAAQAWLKAAQAQAQVQFNRIEWEQQRQQAARIDEDTGSIDVHEDTAEFYRLDDA